MKKQLTTQISDEDMNDLEVAKKLLETDNFAVKISYVFGEGMAKVGSIFPEAARQKILNATMVALEKSWEYSLKTMSAPEETPTPEKKHQQYAILSGAIGGLTIPTLIVELPITTIIMVRSIADIARGQGEDYSQEETKIACLEVFALGGKVSDEETGETGYYAVRTSLKKPMEESSVYMAQKGAAGMGVPFIVQLLAKIAVYYQQIIAITIAIRIVPIVGAIMGAAINSLFIEHFQEKATGHFIVRRLERKYGYETVKQVYQAISPRFTDEPMVVLFQKPVEA